MKRNPVLYAGMFAFLALQAVGGRKPGSILQIRQDGPRAFFSSLKVDPRFGKMPVYFIPNRGQMDERVAYYIQGKDKTIYFADEGITFVLAKERERGEDPSIGRPTRNPRGFEEQDIIRLHSWDRSDRPQEGLLHREEISKRWVVKLDFVGANPESHPEGLEETGTKISYFKGKPEEWKAGIPACSKVIYRGLWPGIDLVYYGTVNRLKYNFVVHPGADPAQIRLSYRGAETVSLDKEGRLLVKTPMGGLCDDVPMAYQEINGKRRNVGIAYKIRERNSPEAGSLGKDFQSDKRIAIPADIPLAANVAGKGGEQSPDRLPRDAMTKTVSYGFRVGDYDRRLPLVMDPVILVYCGYIGGSGDDRGNGIAVDESGNVFVTGQASSTEATFPVTVGPDLTSNGSSDAFVAQVNSSGTGLVYCGYIGGSSNDNGLGIAVDGSGNALITGWTISAEATFPVTVGPDLTINGMSDAFVAKVNSSGTALVYCGYVGGSGGDNGLGIAVDGSGNAYVTGFTSSTEATFPVTVGPDLTINGMSDAFVAKLNSSGTALVYCGYVGGSGDDNGLGIAVDGSGNAYVTGGTYSSEATFPVTVGPDLTHNFYADGFVAKVNSSGTALVYCGYIGGFDGVTGGFAIAVDGSGNAYVTGCTYSSEAAFPVTVGPDLTHNGGHDAFVAKVNTSGTAFSYCGYIGGAGVDYGYGIAVDASGNAYITGYCMYSTEATFPVTIGPDLTYNGGSADAFVAKINGLGTALVYCGYIGGSGYDHGNGIVVDKSGNTFMAGFTTSTEATFPVTAGPDLTYAGNADTFVAKISSGYLGYNVFGSHDFNGDGASDIAVWRPSNGFWYIRGFDNDRWGQVNDIPVPGDYDGDGFTDLAVWRPSDGFWYIRGIDNDKLGQVGDVPVPKDYDGDGSTDLAVWRPLDGTWHIRYRAGGGTTKPWGQAGDFPVPGDYDGDGLPDLAVWRPSTGLWYIKKVYTNRFGQDGDIPVPADYDGDGKMDLAVWRPSDGIWHIRYRAGGGKVKRWGMPGDVPVPGDYNGDGITDMAVWRPSTGQWLILKIDTVRWGASGDIPLVR